jgi:cell division protein FtsI/penicillin-binding protein 2
MADALGQMPAVVCLDPVSGRVLAMSGFDRREPETLVWTEKLVPSASIFKIIAAAGALELLKMTPESRFFYNGGKHTLYRYQLKKKRNRYTNTVTMMEAFRDSINPVFGKIGSAYLKKRRLLEMADRFMWQKGIPFELPVSRSTISVGDDAFNLAEVASGFNKATRITALHGALIVAAIANRGVMMAPSFIDTIKSREGEVVYQSRIYPLTRPVNPRTVDMLFDMMKATVKKGTARKAFSGSGRDRVLKRLEIGGKTGTIDNRSHELRYDWFCGIAREKEGVRSMAVAVVVAHKDVLGTRAASYARLAIKRYFSE